RVLPSKITWQLQPGDVVSVQTPGGGGCELAWQRSPEEVAADVAVGKVSVTRARQAYGVVVHPETYALDAAATRAQRTRQPHEGTSA
ncbi:MAG: hydantoinase B/oxoprolinase family protein, partial [Gammaproteobacteria bacterium]